MGNEGEDFRPEGVRWLSGALAPGPWCLRPPARRADAVVPGGCIVRPPGGRQRVILAQGLKPLATPVRPQGENCRRLDGPGAGWDAKYSAGYFNDFFGGCSILGLD